MFNIGVKSATTDKDAHYRSLAKAVTWRLTGSIDTFILSLLITGNLKIAGSISGVEIITKILLFYGHERVWAGIPWGKRNFLRRSELEQASSAQRSLPNAAPRSLTDTVDKITDRSLRSAAARVAKVD